MSEDFTCYSPTRVHFGEDALGLLGDELKNYGPNVMLSYGGDSIKRSGIYDQLVKVLRKAGKTIIEDGGVMANPVFVIHRDYGRIEPVKDEEKLEEPILTVNDRRMPCPDIGSVLEGARKVRKEGVDLILAVGGGLMADYAKAVSASAYQQRNPWDYYFKHSGKLDSRWIPVGVVLTELGTGSEMNSISFISFEREQLLVVNQFCSFETEFVQIRIVSCCSLTSAIQTLQSSARSLSMPILTRIISRGRAYTALCPASWSSIFRETTTIRATSCSRV